MSSCDNGLTDPANDDRVFLKFYGPNSDGFDVIETIDKGTLIAGSTISDEDGSKDMLLLKTDMRGNAQWIKRFGGLGEDKASRIKRAPDGNYIVVGSYTLVDGEKMNKEICAIKIDGDGNQIWMKTYGHAVGSMVFEDEGIDVAFDASSNLMIIGNTILSDVDSEIMIIYTDSEGQALDDPVLIGQNGTIEKAAAIQADPSGISRAYFAGYTNYREHPDQNGFNLFVGNINRNGSVPFPSIIGGGKNEYTNDMLITADNKLLLLCTEVSAGSSMVFLKKINLDLEVEWSKYPEFDQGMKLQGERMINFEKGHLILATNFISVIDSDLVLQKVDAYGEVLWDEPKIFGGEFNDQGHSMIAGKDNIWITGSMAFSAIGDHINMFLIKSRNNGDLK